jgi:hypothetical protein
MAPACDARIGYASFGARFFGLSGFPIDFDRLAAMAGGGAGGAARQRSTQGALSQDSGAGQLRSSPHVGRSQRPLAPHV